MSKTSHLNQTSDFSVELKIEKLAERRQHVFAKIQIPYSLEQVWQVITDYKTFTEFMPNVSESRQLESVNGRVRLEQVRTKSFMGIKISGRSVYDVVETFPTKIHYQLVEGDMKEFSCYWNLEDWQPSAEKVGVNLSYDMTFLTPSPIFPSVLLEYVLNKDVSGTLVAIRDRVETLFSHSLEDR
jgi:ribosome-associated toxin RatA of RatAB toxin-antitoxin module